MITVDDLSPEPNPLAGYDDWPDFARTADPWTGPDESATTLGRILGLKRRPSPPAVVTEKSTVVDGVMIDRLRWSGDYGPDTTAWLVRPVGVETPLPGVLGMHCHGGVRSIGAEQLIDGGAEASPRALELRPRWYDGLAPANDLARRGFAVLVHDTFSWGSRAFDFSRPTPKLARLVEAQEALWRAENLTPTNGDRFDHISGLHEDTVAKAAGVLGQTFAGLVLTDDLVALDVLAGRPGVDASRLGTFGFSGGGGRSLLLSALDHRIGASVTTCMMATFASLVPSRLDAHSWLLHVPGLWSWIDWPDLTGLGRARHLVQYRRDDALFTPAGMAAAHAHLESRFRGTDRYLGRFHDGDHAFDATMQAEAWAYLSDVV